MDYTIDHCEPFDNVKGNIWMKLEHCGRYLFAADYLKKLGCKRVLDIACAEGYGTRLLEDAGIQAFGADINAEYVRIARTKCKGPISVLDVDKDLWPEMYKDLDAVICFETIEHVSKPELLLANIRNAIKDTGIIMLSIPNDKYEKFDETGKNYDPFHINVFPAEKVPHILQRQGLKILTSYGQSLCNSLYIAEKNALNRGDMSREEIDGLFNYDRGSIISLSRLLAYPDQIDMDNSYSFIYVVKKH